MGLRAGTLRRRLLIQQRSTAQDVYGAQVATWADVATVWAAIEGLSIRERLTSATYSSEVTHLITIRYQAQFKDTRAVAAMRGIYDGRIFNFQGAINVDEANMVITILAGEGLNDG